jgi:hypothetical protein
MATPKLTPEEKARRAAERKARKELGEPKASKSIFTKNKETEPEAAEEKKEISAEELPKMTEIETPEDESYKDPEEETEEQAPEPETSRKLPPKKKTPPPVEFPPTENQTDRVYFDNEQDAENAEQSATTSEAATVASLFPGEALVTLLSKGLGVLIPLGINAMAGTKLTPKDFALTAEEKRTLKPAVENCAKQIPVNFENPWIMLGVSIVAIYGAKAAEVINFEDLTKSKKRK